MFLTWPQAVFKLSEDVYFLIKCRCMLLTFCAKSCILYTEYIIQYTIYRIHHKQFWRMEEWTRSD